MAAQNCMLAAKFLILKLKMCAADKYNKNTLSQLVDSSKKYFKKLSSSSCISYKEMKYFTYEHKKECNLRKFYLLPKIHKRLFNVPGRPVISNCGTPTEKISEFLDHHLKPVMQKGISYVRLSTFFRKNKNYWKCSWKSYYCHCWCSRLYPNIPHQAGLNALKKSLEKRDIKNIPTEDLVKNAEFVLNNNIFQFNSK